MFPGLLNFVKITESRRNERIDWKEVKKNRFLLLNKLTLTHHQMHSYQLQFEHIKQK